MKLRILSVFLAAALLLVGCGIAPRNNSNGETVTFHQPAAAETVPGSIPDSIDPSDLFSDRDEQSGYEADSSAAVRLTGDTATCSSNAVSVSGGTVTIRDEGTYILSGTLNNGMIIVNADKSDKVQLVLNGVNITSATSAPVYILQADKVFITLAEGCENTLSNGGSFVAIDENNIDAVIFSKEDLTLNGSGALSIASPAGHGIVSKDDLTVEGGSCTITCASHGLAGKDSISITGASLDIASGKDGIHAENNDDAALGFVYIQDGSFIIRAEGDGISAAAKLQIDGGTFDIITGGGSVNGEKQTSDNWGGFGGGGGGRPGGMMGGSRPGSVVGSVTTDTDEDSTSIKGMKAAGSLLINSGSFTIDSADDAVHSNADLTVGGGNFTISTGDDGFHADEALSILAGTIDISKSYEGLEGLSITMSGGDISLISSDDGLNAAGGNDQSGFGGFGGGRGDKFGGSGNSNSFILISGGTLFVNANGDGIDSNGKLTIDGGNITVHGPTNGDTAVLDFDTTGIITGGTFIGTGASMMAQTFTGSENQGIIAVQVGNQSAGTKIAIGDSAGKTIIEAQPNLSFAIVIVSCPDIASGQTYTVTVGSLSGNITAD